MQGLPGIGRAVHMCLMFLCHSEQSEESHKKIDQEVNFLYDNAIIAGSSKGRTWDFESQYLGSIPSPAVTINSD